MGCVVEFGGEVLASPVLVVLAVAPEPRGRHVVDNALVGAPYFVAVLPISEC